MLLFMYPSAVTTSKLRTAASAQLRQGSGVQPRGGGGGGGGGTLYIWRQRVKNEWVAARSIFAAKWFN